MKCLFKAFTFLVFIYYFSSCSNSSVTLDFSTITFPKDSIQKRFTIKDLLESHQNNKRFTKPYISLSTDKNTYRPGETAILTITNVSKDKTEQFFPNSQDEKRQELFYRGLTFNAETARNQFEISCISNSPAITGDLIYEDTRLISLLIQPLGTFYTKKLDYTPFKHALSPGEELHFSIHLPNRTGHYSFSVHRFPPENSNGWNINYYGIGRLAYSNAIEIK